MADAGIATTTSRKRKEREEEEEEEGGSASSGSRCDDDHDDEEEDYDGEEGEEAAAPLVVDPHTARVHDKYRMCLANDSVHVPSWKAFEMMVCIATNTFPVDEAPLSFFDDEPLIGTSDCGIDHISIDKKTVGQSKCYSAKTVDWKDAARFHLAADSLRAPPSRRFFAVLPTTQFTRNVAKAVELHKYEVMRFHAPEGGGEADVPRPDDRRREADVGYGQHLVLRASQEEALRAFESASEKTFRMQAPPGWGKTFVCLTAVERMRARAPTDVALVLVPSCDLLDQMVDAFRCRGMRTARAEVGMDESAEVVVATYQAAMTNALRSLLEHREVGMVIADEAHHLDADNKWRERVHDLASGERTRVLALSGLYARSTRVDHDVPYESAIEEGVVADYCVVLQHWTGGDRAKAIADYVRDTPELGPLVLVFWNSREAATRCHEECLALGVPSRSVFGDTPDRDRRTTRRMAEQGQVRVLHLCGCYNEGVSIPLVSTVVFGDPRSSVKNVFQCQARANRLHPTKPFYRVVLPVFGTDDVDLADVGHYIGVLASSDPRVHDAVLRAAKGEPTTRVRVVAVRNDGEAACTRIVEYMGSVLRNDYAAKIHVLAQLDKAPKQGDTLYFVRPDKTRVSFDGGVFLKNVLSSHCDTKHACLANLEWYQSRLEKRRQSSPKDDYAAKIQVLAELDEAPKKGKTLYFVRADATKVPFDGGMFLDSVLSHHCDTKHACLANLEWYQSRLEKRRQSSPKDDYAAKIQVLAELDEAPKSGETLYFYRADAIKVPFDGGKFLDNVLSRHCDTKYACLLNLEWYRSRLERRRTRA